MYWNVAKKSFSFSVNSLGKKFYLLFFCVFFSWKKKRFSQAQKKIFIQERNLRRIMKWKAAIIARPPRLTKCQFRNVFVPCPAPHTLLSPPLSPPPQNYSKQLLQKKYLLQKRFVNKRKKRKKTFSRKWKNRIKNRI